MNSRAWYRELIYSDNQRLRLKNGESGADLAPGVQWRLEAYPADFGVWSLMLHPPRAEYVTKRRIEDREEEVLVEGSEYWHVVGHWSGIILEERLDGRLSLEDAQYAAVELLLTCLEQSSTAVDTNTPEGQTHRVRAQHVIEQLTPYRDPSSRVNANN